MQEIEISLLLFEVPIQYTVAINELLCMKNAGAQIAMDFSKNEVLAPMAVEKKQNPGERFGALPIQPIYPEIRPNGLVAPKRPLGF